MPGGRGLAVGGGLGTLVIVLVAMWLGVDPSVVLQGGEPVGTEAPSPGASAPSAAKDPLADFVSVVLADTEDTWRELFRRMDRQYQDPILVLFSGGVRSACGVAQSSVGPFYCPGDRKLYIDLAFYRDLRDRLGAPGDFAQAYVIAHELGHHVQNLLGLEAHSRGSSVPIELQADCFAGVWGHHAGNAKLLDPGDVEEGLAAATAIGDDRLQKQQQGYVVPESFTHGSSAQRVSWFRRGLQSGRMEDCDTFSSSAL